MPHYCERKPALCFLRVFAFSAHVTSHAIRIDGFIVFEIEIDQVYAYYAFHEQNTICYGMRGVDCGGTETVNIVSFNDIWGRFNYWLDPKFLIDNELNEENIAKAFAM